MSAATATCVLAAPATHQRRSFSLLCSTRPLLQQASSPAETAAAAAPQSSEAINAAPSAHEPFFLTPAELDAMIAEELPTMTDDPMFDEERKQSDLTAKTLRDDLAGAEAAFTPSIPENERALVRMVFTTMLACTERMAKIRAQPTTMASFLEMQQLDVRRDRCRHAVFVPFEHEAFANEEEKTLSAEALRKKAFACLDDSDSAGAIHCLRLAAVHYGDCTSMMALHGLNAKSPDNICRSASLLYQFATKGTTHDTIDPALNAFVANEFRRGTHFFPPFYAASAYFYQRAALAGHEASLFDLYRLFSTLAAEAEASGNTVGALRHKERARYFLGQGAALGRLDALLTSALQHIVGLLGTPKDLAKAKGFMQRALELSPELAEERRKKTEVAKGVTVADLMRMCEMEYSH